MLHQGLLLTQRNNIHVRPSSPKAIFPKKFPSMSTMERIPITLIPSPSTTPKPTGITDPFHADHIAFLLNAINSYRKSLGLSIVNTNDTVCQFARVRSLEISTDFSHNGFNQRVKNRGLPYSTYSLVTENIAETPDYQNVIVLWKNSPPHAKNLQANTPYVCVENYGNYYAYEGWKE